MEIIDVSAAYHWEHDCLAVYQCGRTSIGKKLLSCENDMGGSKIRFKMEDRVCGARFVSQTGKQPNIVILTCKHCLQCCSYMTWRNGDECAELYAKQCNSDKYLATEVIMNSDEFMIIFGLAHGVLFSEDI